MQPLPGGHCIVRAQHNFGAEMMYDDIENAGTESSGKVRT